MNNILKLIKSPIIIIGMHRSGTSFLTKALASNGCFMGYDLSPNNESFFFQKQNIEIFKKNNSSWDNPQQKFNMFYDIDLQFKEFTNRYLRNNNKLLFKFVIKKNKWGWKDPRNTYTLPYWLKLFPNAKVIHIYRNGLDVAISLYNRNKKENPNSTFYSKPLKNIKSGLVLWERYTQKAFTFKDELKNNYIDIKFEKLIQNDKKEVAKILKLTNTDISEYIKKNADTSRTKRYTDERFNELYSYGKTNNLLKKLLYV